MVVVAAYAPIGMALGICVATTLPVKTLSRHRKHLFRIPRPPLGKKKAVCLEFNWGSGLRCNYSKVTSLCSVCSKLSNGNFAFFLVVHGELSAPSSEFRVHLLHQSLLFETNGAITFSEYVLSAVNVLERRGCRRSLKRELMLLGVGVSQRGGVIETREFTRQPDRHEE